MGGSSNRSSTPPPQQAQPIDFSALMAASSANAAAQTDNQFRSMVKWYPDMERQQLGTIGNISSMLSAEGGTLYGHRKGRNGQMERFEIGKADPNLYTGAARDAVTQALTQREPIDLTGDKLSAIGDFVTSKALESYNQSGPSSIEQRLYNDAESDLALGRSLSPEQQREAAQAARGAAAARGLGASAGTSAMEILNRDAYGSQREAERRNFAGAANDMLSRNVMARRDQAAQQAGLGSNILANAGQTYLGSANLGLAGAERMIGIDPTQRAIAPGIGLGGQTMGMMGNMIGSTYQSANQLAGNVAGFNANMMDSRYNSWANMQAANRSAGAMERAGMYGMIGGIAGGVLGGAGMVRSDRREKKNIKPIGKAGSVLGLKAYEFEYKDGGRKRVGFMAQDVKKVLPEAVSEVIYNGKKRLAIKPAVLGQALTQELMAA